MIWFRNLASSTSFKSRHSSRLIFRDKTPTRSSNIDQSDCSVQLYLPIRARVVVGARVRFSIRARVTELTVRVSLGLVRVKVSLLPV